MLKTSPELKHMARGLLLLHDNFDELDAMGIPEDDLQLFEFAVTDLAERLEAAISDCWIEYRTEVLVANSPPPPKSGMMINAEQG